MNATEFEYIELDPCRVVSIVSSRHVVVSDIDQVAGIRLVLRHHRSGREFSLVAFAEGDGGIRVVSEYAVFEDLRGLRTGRNNRGQMFWQKYVYPDGWITARYMFPDEQDAYQAAVVMSADFEFLRSQVDRLPH